MVTGISGQQTSLSIGIVSVGAARNLVAAPPSKTIAEVCPKTRVSSAIG